MTKQKQYIGSGKATKFGGVRITLRMDQAAPHSYTTESGEYLSFFVDVRKEADQYGRTHTAYVLVDTPVAEPEMAEPATVSEPAPEVVVKGGRRLRRISPEEAAARRAALEDMRSAA